MASDINAVFMIGRLTRDPDLKYTKNGSAVCSFSIANNRTYVTCGNKKEQVLYFNCVAWGKTGEVVAEYCKKGHRIGIEGRLLQRSWEDKNGNKRQTVEITVERIQFLQSQAKSSAPAEKSDPSFPDPLPAKSDDHPFSDEDMPF